MYPHIHAFPHFLYESEQYVNYKAIAKQIPQWEIYGKDSLKAIEKIRNNVMIVDVAEAMLTATGQSGLVLVSLFNLNSPQSI